MFGSVLEWWTFDADETHISYRLVLLRQCALISGSFTVLASAARIQEGARRQIMKLSVVALATGTVLLLGNGPALAGHAAGGMGGAMPSHMSQGSVQGQGWNHMNGPSHTGQPNVSCGSPAAPFTPGNAASAPGSAFNPTGTAGSKYAGQQPQNSRNTASVAQYDAACAHQK